MTQIRREPLRGYARKFPLPLGRAFLISALVACAGAQDSDSDGLPDEWEVRFGLNPAVSDKNMPGDGSDGTLIVPAGQTLVHIPFGTTATGTNPAGAAVLNVADSSGFASGDLVMLWIAQDSEANPANNVGGRFQLCRVSTKSPSALNLTAPLLGAFNAAAGRKIVVQKVPEYRSLKVDGTLEAPPWDGSKGGMLAICAWAAEVGSSGKISVAGKGFRGGADYAQADVDGFQGESYLGMSGARSVGAHAGGGGGGGRSFASSGNGGGGGGFGVAGGLGGVLHSNFGDRPSAYQGGSGGLAHGAPDLAILLPGSGGGSGGQDGDNGNDDMGMNGGSGGAGGGVLVLLGGTIDNDGIISADGSAGAAGLSAPVPTERGGGGGGSGGALHLAGSYSGTGSLSASGGSGGGSYHLQAAGGAGGDGRIRMDLPSGAVTPGTNPPVGFNGAFPAILTAPATAIASYGDDDQDGLDTLGEAMANTNPFDSDSDGDGIDDAWEFHHGGNPTLDDAASDADGDGLTLLREYYLNINPLANDTDGDGLSDMTEVGTSGSNPFLADSDGDGMPDGWEHAHGLDPRRDDAGEDRDQDFISNRDEYAGGSSSSNPSAADTDNDGISDYAELHPGSNRWEALYDRNNRLLGVRHARGSSFAYRYDANGNPLRQVKLGLDRDGDGLSDLWEFAHGLNPDSALGNDGATGDPDHDGWSNLQEQAGLSSPSLAADRPGVNGTVIGSFNLPFTPANFVSTAGQLDHGGIEELVVAADGDPAGAANVVRIFTEAGGNWTSEDVSVGDYGVTSLAVARIAGRTPAIYVGQRKAGGTARLLELIKTGGVWQSTVVTETSGEELRVLGMCAMPWGDGLLFNGSMSFGASGGIYKAEWRNGSWNVTQADDERTTQRGTGIVLPRLGTARSGRAVRLLDRGGIQITGFAEFPTFEDFDDGQVNPLLWTQGGGTDSNAVVSVSENGGLFQLNLSWNSSGDGSVTMETPDIWAGGQRGLLLKIASARHQVSKLNSQAIGDSWVTLGNTTVFSTGVKALRTDVWLQLENLEQTVRFRTGSGSPIAWSAWASIPVSGRLLFGVDGHNGPADNPGSAHMHVDFIRFQSTLALADDLAAFPSDYLPASSTWYFKSPDARDATGFQRFARAHGGDTVTVDSSDLSTWLQGRFGDGFWIGQMRDSGLPNWKWASGSPSVYANWLAGQPAADPSHLAAFTAGSSWSSAAGSELRPGLLEIKAQAVETALVPEATAGRRLDWQAQPLAGGRFNPAVANQASFVQAFVDDKDDSGSVTAGDEFVVAEHVADSPLAPPRTLNRRTLTSGHASYGLTAARTSAGTSDLLLTAENDGKVHAWLAPPAGGGAMTRHLLSAEHAGKAWHGLSRIPMGGGTDGIAGLRVSPEQPQTTEVVFWSPADLGFSAPPLILLMPPSAAVAPLPERGGASSPVNVALWDSDGSPARLELQYQESPGSGAWQDCTLLLIAGYPAAGEPLLATTISGQTYPVVWNARADLGASFNGGVLLRARAEDIAGAGPWSSPMYYFVEVSADGDGDGIPDDWENTHGLDPFVHDSEADKDHDGLANLIEFAVGSDPGVALTGPAPAVFFGDIAGVPSPALPGSYLIMVVPKNPLAANLLYSVQVSNDLDTWNSGPPHLTVLEEGPTQLKVRTTVPLSTASRQVMRLKVTAP